MKTLYFQFFLLFLSPIESAGPGKVASKPSKLCADEKCTVPLFTSKVTRALPNFHEQFLNGLKESDEVQIVAFKFSNRPDMMEAITVDGQRGFILDGMIQRSPFAGFLKKAIDGQFELKVISQDNKDIGEKRVLGTVLAHLDLIRDYNVAAKRAAAELGAEPPPELPVPEIQPKGHTHSHSHSHDAGHGHSHGGNDHSHEGHGHSHEPGHSHDESHGHSHGSLDAAAGGFNKLSIDPPQPPTTEPPVEPPQPPTTEPPQPPVEQPKEVIEEKKVELAENSTTPTPAPTPTPTQPVQPPIAHSPPPIVDGNSIVDDVKLTTEAEINEEIERLMQKDIEMMEKIKTEDTEEPIEEPKIETVKDTVVEVEAPEEKPIVETTPPPIQMPRLSSLDILGKRAETGDPTPAPVQQEDEKVDMPKVETIQPLEPVKESEIPTITHDTPTIEPPQVPEPPPVQVEKPVDVTPPPDLPSDEFCHGDECGKVKPLTTEQQTLDPPETTTTTTTTTTTLPIEDPQQQPVQQVADFVDMEELARQATQPGVLSRGLSMITNVFRAVPGLSGLSDGGIGIVLNLTVLAISIVMWFFNNMLSGSDPVASNLRAAHDMATRNKELETLLKERENELMRFKQAGGNDAHALQSFRTENSSLHERVNQLQERLAVVEPDLRKETDARAHYETDLAKEREAMAILRKNEDELRHRLAASEKQSTKATQELEEQQDRASKLDAKLNEVRTQKERLDGELNNTKTKVEELRADLRRVNEELSKETKMREDLAVLEVEFRHMIAELQAKLAEAALQPQSVAVTKSVAEKKTTEASSASGSGGGSNGWSDIEDFEENEAEKERKEKERSASITKSLPVTQIGDIQEVARLRGEIKRLELQVASTKNELEHELTLKKALQEKVNSLEEAIKQKGLELDKSEVERRQAFEQSTKLLQMLDGAHSKSNDSEVQISNLRDEARKLQEEARIVDDERRKKEQQLKDVEEELKKLRNDHLKLETKHFNLSREHRSLMDQRALGAGPGDLLGGGGLGPSGAERMGAGSRSGGLLSGVGFDASAWDEPPMVQPHQTHRIGSSPEDFEAGMPQIRRSSRSRRSERRQSPSDAEGHRRSHQPVYQKEPNSPGHRRRSRSQGRQPYMGYNDYGLFNTAPQRGPLLPNRPGSHTGGSVGMGGHMYYSSGGSNSGRSPPPEMIAHSAVPPVGLHKPKGTRAVDLNAAFK
ncbi:unnamed protein product, partial [Mesorhabditis belari]|uniref:Uncharacterized protein n=1 Tax=Mesorhabditis belari TaxID=2138241 RepID=A0AAF3FJP5_9BILA